MPEGDTIYRTAEVMRRTLHDDEIVAARGGRSGVPLERVVGSRVASVSALGKHLLVAFDNGLTLHTHLRMRGTWHRYRPRERWRLPADEAVAVLETGSAVVVCFRAPTVELIETRALPLHPVLSQLGPDLLDAEVDLDEATTRLRSSRITVAEALLDQRLVAGIGNVYRSEVLHLCGQDPMTRACDLPEDQAARLLTTARDLLAANTGGGQRVTMADASGARPDASDAGSRSRERWVYRRAGRPCRHCATPIRSRTLGRPLRQLYWCPACQRPGS